MTTISPAPFPEGGVRKLSYKETMQRAKAAACTVPQDNRPTCSGQVFVGIFFDGTGNNLKLDYETPSPDKRKHTNIVKLFQAYRVAPLRGYYPFYISGVGTPFPQIGDSNNYIGPNRGSVAGERGEARVIWAFTQLLNAPHQFVFNNAPLIPDAMAKTITNNVAGTFEPAIMRRVVLNTWQDKLKAALAGNKPTVEQINLSVFGFSRGSAEARAFVNWLFEVCKEDGGGWTFAGIPIRVQFLGIFDTVASVGLANLYDNGVLNGHQSWADNNLEIHPAVEQCVHYVAGHEIRACFPSDSVRVKSSYPGNAMEVMYPGAHSDVGGGYAPSDLGVSPSQGSFLAIIPGVNMYHEARKAGVPLIEWGGLNEAVQRALTPSTAVITDFNAYLGAAKIGTGSIEELGRRNMSLYFSYRFKYLTSYDYYQTAPYEHSSRTDQGYLYTTQRSFFMQLAKLRELITKNDPQFAATWPFQQKYGSSLDRASRSWDEMSAAPSTLDKAMNMAWKYSTPGMLVAAVKAPFAAAQEKNSLDHAFEVAQSIRVESVTPEIQTFFDRYIHDSEAGFIAMGMNEYAYNGIGIVKFRTVYKGNG